MNKEVETIFKNYPGIVRDKMLHLRKLVFETAAEENITAIEETLKWGEPSYLAKGGSTLRMDWKASKPDQYALYFNCKTSLVDTFKELYKDEFKYEGNRAIVFDLNKPIPLDEIKYCILLALTYHSRKHLPLLGA